MQCWNPQLFKSRQLSLNLNTCQFSSTTGLFFYDLKLTELRVLHELPGPRCCKVAEVGQPWWSTSSELLVSGPCFIMLVLMKEDALSQRRVLMIMTVKFGVVWMLFPSHLNLFLSKWQSTVCPDCAKPDWWDVPASCMGTGSSPAHCLFGKMSITSVKSGVKF